MKFAAFLLPLALWCLVSYCWHTKVRVTDAGDSETLHEDILPKIPRTAAYSEGQFLTPEQFDEENKLLSANNLKPMTGHPSFEYWLPAPHEVAVAFYTAFTTPPPNAKKGENPWAWDRVWDDVNPFHLSAPDDPWLAESLALSCKVVFWGFLLSAIVGVPLGVLCGTFDFASKGSEPFVDFIRYMPAPAFGILCMAMLGIYASPKIAIIWIGTFFQMVLVVANTTRQFDIGLLEAAQTLGARRRSLLGKVILPGILPNLYNDMRILLGWAWTYLIVAEVGVGTSTGISYYIYFQGGHELNFANVFVGIITIGVIGLTVDQFLAYLAKFLFPWQPSMQSGGLLGWIIRAVAYFPRKLLAAARRPAVAAP